MPDPVKNLLHNDPYLAPYETTLRRRLDKIKTAFQKVTAGCSSLSEFASGHEYFGLHFKNGRWCFREWAPNASAVFLVGTMNGWQEQDDYRLHSLGPTGVWEIELEPDRISHKDLYRLSMHWNGGKGDRIPAWARRVVQDPDTLIFNAQVWRPASPYQWQHADFQRPGEDLYIYEAHVGIAQDDARVGTYAEFTQQVLPRIADAGYNTIQLMAIQEHPYYGSFGYQVSNFFAASSRFGTPTDLKQLVDSAHAHGLTIIMDLVHSHAVANEVEGLSRFDGTTYQYFHAGARGHHHAWDSRCFDYGKLEVMHFLLSNCRFWLDEYHFDGFRFDGITSMLYLHHGLGKAFVHYDDYYDENVDEDALTYLALANHLVHEVRPDAVTIAEDVSGMPGLAASEKDGGIGFDYRFAMGVPDYWIRLTKETRDEDWPVGHLWHELINRRHDEKTISYAESHDQALVGDQSLIFRLIGSDMYDHMTIPDRHLNVDRGLALHKLIRLITLATAGNGYLNFMGNEFGHPEWIDFPREGNQWSYHYARRQWHLVDDPGLKYHLLARFDRHMIRLARSSRLYADPGPKLVYEHNSDKILAFERREMTFVFNFHPGNSYPDYRIPAAPGKYRILLDTDDAQFGGHQRLEADQPHFTTPAGDTAAPQLSLYLPNRSAQVLKRIDYSNR